MGDPEQSGATPEEFKAITGVDNDPDNPPFGVAVTPQALVDHRIHRENLDQDQTPADRSEAEVVQGVAAETLPAEQRTEQQQLLDDFKELNRIYNGALLTEVPTKDGSEKMVFSRALMVDESDRAYIGGIDDEGLFLVRGSSADGIHGDKRFQPKKFGSVMYEEYIVQGNPRSVAEYGEPGEERVVDAQSMGLWENSYRATKEKLDMSRVELPNVRKAREIVRQAIDEQKTVSEAA